MAKLRKDQGLAAAVEAANGLARLAELLGVPIQNVCRWHRVPAHWVIPIEEATGIPRERLRPDLYGAPRPRPRRKHQQSIAA